MILTMCDALAACEALVAFGDARLIGTGKPALVAETINAAEWLAEEIQTATAREGCFENAIERLARAAGGLLEVTEDDVDLRGFAVLARFVAEALAPMPWHFDRWEELEERRKMEVIA